MSWQYGDQSHLPGVRAPEPVPCWAKEKRPDLFGDRVLDSEILPASTTSNSSIEPTFTGIPMAAPQPTTRPAGIVARSPAALPTALTPELAEALAKLNADEHAAINQFSEPYERALLAKLPVTDRLKLVEDIRNHQETGIRRLANGVTADLSLARHLAYLHNPTSPQSIGSGSLSIWSNHCAVFADYERIVVLVLRSRLAVNDKPTSVNVTVPEKRAQPQSHTQVSIDTNRATISINEQQPPLTSSSIVVMAEQPPLNAPITAVDSSARADVKEDQASDKGSALEDDRSPSSSELATKKPCLAPLVSGGLVRPAGFTIPHLSLNNPTTATVPMTEITPSLCTNKQALSASTANSEHARELAQDSAMDARISCAAKSPQNSNPGTGPSSKAIPVHRFMNNDSSRPTVHRSNMLAPVTEVSPAA
jgi:hypothetical protein